MKLKPLGLLIALGMVAFSARCCGEDAPRPRLAGRSCGAQGGGEIRRSRQGRSNGDIEIKVFANGVLGNEREMLEQVQNGVLEITKASASPLETFSPDYKVFNLPFVFRDRAHFFNVLTSPVGESILASSKKSGFIGLAYYDSGARSFRCCR